jgi:hypothetical protein
VNQDRYYVYDFWNDCFVGRLKGTQRLTQTLRPGEARMLSVHRVVDHPQLLSTDRHLMQGYLDLAARPAWNAASSTLTATSRLLGASTYRVVLALNGMKASSASADGAKASIQPLAGPTGLAVLEISSPTTPEVTWSVKFEKNTVTEVSPKQKQTQE